MPAIRHIEPLLPSGPPPPSGVTPPGINSAQAFGTLKITLSVTPAGIASGQAFGTAQVAIRKVVHPTGIPSGEVWGHPKLQLLRATTTVAPIGIGSVAAFGHPTVSRGVAYIYPVGIPGAEAFGLGGIGHPFIIPAPTGAGPLPLMLVRRSGLRH